MEDLEKKLLVFELYLDQPIILSQRFLEISLGRDLVVSCYHIFECLRRPIYGKSFCSGYFFCVLA